MTLSIWNATSFGDLDVAFSMLDYLGNISGIDGADLSRLNLSLSDYAGLAYGFGDMESFWDVSFGDPLDPLFSTMPGLAEGESLWNVTYRDLEALWLNTFDNEELLVRTPPLISLVPAFSSSLLVPLLP